MNLKEHYARFKMITVHHLWRSIFKCFLKLNSGEINITEINITVVMKNPFFLLKHFPTKFREELHPFSRNHIFCKFTKKYTVSKVNIP